MATLKVLTTSPADSFRIYLMFGGIWHGSLDYSSPSVMVFSTPENNQVVINGTKLQYDISQENPWSDGTVTSIALWNSDFTKKIAEITDLGVDLSELGPKLDGPLYGMEGVVDFLFSRDDNLIGSAYDDSFYAYDGNDTILAGAGDDYIAAGRGDDVIDGGTGFDIVSYWDYSLFSAEGITGVTVDLNLSNVQDPWGGADQLVSIEGVEGTPFADTLTGNDSGNVLYGLGGQDVLVGLGGNDFFVGGESADTIDGGEGSDMMSFVDSIGAALVLDLSTGKVVDPWGYEDTFSNIEGVRATGNADSLTGAGTDDFFQGMGGDDTIDGAVGDDTVSYTADQDWGGVLGVNVNLETGTATDGFGSTDTLINIESAEGTDFADVLRGSAVANYLSGEGGNDLLVGLQGNDTLSGGGGNDQMSGDEGDDDLYGGDGNDILQGYTGNDYIDVGSGDNTAWGYDGNDVIIGGSGRNTLYGNRGNDTIYGGSGNERIFGDGSTTTGGADVLYGGAGNDTLSGGSGRDSFVFDTKLNAKTNVDRITDYSAASDTIFLDHKVFTKLKIWFLDSSAFVVGTKAKDKSDKIIYNNKTGELFYDPDGTGKAAQVKFAVLETKAKLTASEFFIY